MRWKRFIKKKPKKDGWYYCTIFTYEEGFATKVLYWDSGERTFSHYLSGAVHYSSRPGPYASRVILNEDVVAWTTLPKLYSRKK